MSIRTVKCPGCGTSANVPAAMANVKCASCGTVWNVNNPAAAKPAATARSTGSGSSSPANSSGGAANSQAKLLATGIGGLLVLLAIVGIAIAFFVGSDPQPVSQPADKPEPQEPVVVASPAPAPPTFREVNLPESTRKSIYLDYRKLVGSSTEKKIMIMKESPVNKSLQSMLGKTVDREITHFSLIHKISEDDVMQIVAEGDAKQWPGARKPEPDDGRSQP